VLETLSNNCRKIIEASTAAQLSTFRGLYFNSPS
jgi:hypothetical protein